MLANIKAHRFGDMDIKIKYKPLRYRKPFPLKYLSCDIITPGFFFGPNHVWTVSIYKSRKFCRLQANVPYEEMRYTDYITNLLSFVSNETPD